MAPPFPAQTMPLGFVPVEPISRHAGRRTVRGGRVPIGRDGYVGDARASGGSRIIPCGTGRQLAAATAVAAASSSIAATVADNYYRELLRTLVSTNFAGCCRATRNGYS